MKSKSAFNVLVSTANPHPYNTGVLQDVMKHKLVFIETQDVVETSLALDNYRRACNCGRGAVFLSVRRCRLTSA